MSTLTKSATPREPHVLQALQCGAVGGDWCPCKRTLTYPSPKASSIHHGQTENMFQPSAPESLILSLSVYSLQTGSCPTEPRSNKPLGYQRPWDPCVFQPLQDKGLLNKALGARAAVRWFRRIVIGRQNIKSTSNKIL